MRHLRGSQPHWRHGGSVPNSVGGYLLLGMVLRSRTGARCYSTLAISDARQILATIVYASIKR